MYNTVSGEGLGSHWTGTDINACASAGHTGPSLLGVVCSPVLGYTRGWPARRLGFKRRIGASAFARPRHAVGHQAGGEGVARDPEQLGSAPLVTAAASDRVQDVSALLLAQCARRRRGGERGSRGSGGRGPPRSEPQDRKSVVQGERGELGGR